MHHSAYQVLQKYFNVGIAQIFPVFISILIIFLMIGFSLFFLIYTPLYQETTDIDNESILFVFIFSSVSILCLSGLFAFLVSSFRFIQAKQKKDYNSLIKGMYSLNWASIILTLFTTTATSFTALALLFYR